MQTNFADTILNITLTGPLVRIDLGTMTPVVGENDEKGTRTTLTQQLVMPLDGFLRAFGLQESVIKKLIADGVVKPSAVSEPN